jgi:hypothetical protein
MIFRIRAGFVFTLRAKKSDEITSGGESATRVSMWMATEKRLLIVINISLSVFIDVNNFVTCLV